MRFAEFKKYLFEAEGQPGYYVIGDSHAVAIGKRKPWNPTAVGGHQANSSDVAAKVPQITPGSIVVVAAGANDTANSYKSANKDPKKVIAPNVIASRVVNLINSVRNQKPKKIIFLLFPNGKARTDGMAQWYNGDYQEQVRTAIKNAISV
jgi:lysophospholipase L1-like esterase